MYDLKNVFSQISTNRANLTEYATTIRDGGVVDGIMAFEDPDAATPIMAEVELWGMDEMESRIEGLRNRVRVIAHPEPEIW